VVVAAAPSGTVTFLFTDIEGSTAAWDRHPAEMERALARHDAILRDAIAAAAGYVFSTGGDGLAAAFSSAAEAVGAAVEAQRALGVEPWPEPLAIKVRMGLHTGATVERDGDYFGPTVIRAARLMGLVGGGRVVCSAATAGEAKACTPVDVDFVPVGSVTLTGLAAAEDVFAVSGPGLAETGAAVGLAPGAGTPVPIYAGRLLGRDEELATVTTGVRTAPLTTVTGPGGVGKTRLTAEACRAVRDRFAEGISWVDLALVSRVDDVGQAVADALGVSSAPGERLAPRIAAALRGRSVLVVLDNCEHVSEAVVSLVRELLAAQDTSRLLATSREPLGVGGEVVVEVAPLASEGIESPAVGLMLDRIGPVSSRSLAELEELARELDGIPLALELAAARCRTFGVAPVLDEVRESFAVLVDEKRTVGRHRSLTAALEWSFRLLSDREQRMLQALSLFAGEFDLAGARRLAKAIDLDHRTADAITASLVDRSLISVTEHGLRLLTPTRDFARASAAGEPVWASLEDAHTAFISVRCAAIHDGLRGADEKHWIEDLDSMWPDVRSVVRRAFDRDDVATIASLVPLFGVIEAFWRRDEVFAWAAEADAKYHDVPVEGRRDLLACASIAAWLEMNIPLAVELAEAAMAADPTPGVGDCQPEASAIGAYNYAGRFDDAAETARRCLARLSDGDLYGEAYMTANLAVSLGIGGADPAEATELAARAVRVARAIGNQTVLAYALYVLALVASHDPKMAAAAAQEAHAIAVDTSNEWVLRMTTAFQAGLLPGEPVELAAVLDVVEAFYRSGYAAHAWTVLLGVVAPLLFRLGRDQDAALVVGACEASDMVEFKSSELPAESRQALEDDHELMLSRRLGARLGIPEVLRTLLTS
jgi:predicted ATPase/class 3 adenylate cyclase